MIVKSKFLDVILYEKPRSLSKLYIMPMKAFKFTLQAKIRHQEPTRNTMKKLNRYIKGQLISNCPFDIFNSPKKQTK